jgi:hypothetical protein
VQILSMQPVSCECESPRRSTSALIPSAHLAIRKITTSAATSAMHTHPGQGEHYTVSVVSFLPCTMYLAPTADPPLSLMPARSRGCL